MNRFAIALVIGALSSYPVFGGVVFEVETTDHEQSSPKAETTEVAAEGKNLKMNIRSGNRGSDGDMIFRGDRREMVVIDHDDKSYYLMDEETLSSIAGQVNQALSQVQEALKQVPEDQRAMVEKMMKQHLPGETEKREPPKLRKTSERAEKGGYPCLKYEVSRDDQKIRELWVTDWSQIEGGGEAKEAFQSLAGFFAEMMESFESVSGTGGFPSHLEDNPFAYMKDLDGFPVVTRELGDDGSLESESVLRSSQRRSLDPEEFEPPSGYKRRTMGPLN
ncbi:MAG: DUF4412 domain-containing protein [Deltaproteobacteria bacterium]|nr:DUF4412 domain-containing protein [Deltaproteobacteria bacterium]